MIGSPSSGASALTTWDIMKHTVWNDISQQPDWNVMSCYCCWFVLDGPCSYSYIWFIWLHFEAHPLSRWRLDWWQATNLHVDQLFRAMCVSSRHLHSQQSLISLNCETVLLAYSIGCFSTIRRRIIPELNSRLCSWLDSHLLVSLGTFPSVFCICNCISCNDLVSGLFCIIAHFDMLISSCGTVLHERVHRGSHIRALFTCLHRLIAQMFL